MVIDVVIFQASCDIATVPVFSMQIYQKSRGAYLNPLQILRHYVLIAEFHDHADGYSICCVFLSEADIDDGTFWRPHLASLCIISNVCDCTGYNELIAADEHPRDIPGGNHCRKSDI